MVLSCSIFNILHYCLIHCSIQAECEGWLEVVDLLVDVFEKGDISQLKLVEQKEERQRKIDQQVSNYSHFLEVSLCVVLHSLELHNL